MKASERGEMERVPPVEVFRPRVWMRSLVILLTVFWVLVFFLLIRIGGAAGSTFASVGFFVTFFTGLSIFYSNNSIELLPDAFVVRGVASNCRVPYALVTEVEVTRGFVQTTYRVRTPVRPLLFSSLFAGHERLGRLIDERARKAKGMGLEPFVG